MKNLSKTIMSVILVVVMVVALFASYLTKTTFAEETSSNEFVIENGILKEYHGSGGNVVIPNSVTGIGNYVFRGCNRLTSITIPNSVTSIGNYAFAGCSNLTGIIIPNSVTIIGDYAFAGCIKLKNITIPNSVTSIGKGAFNICLDLTSVVIPDSVTSLGYGAFSGCRLLKSITIPDSITRIEMSTFSYCWCLESITIPGSVTHIAADAFENCFSLKSVKGYTGSYAETFIKNKGYEFMSLGQYTPPTSNPAPVSSVGSESNNISIKEKTFYNIVGNDDVIDLSDAQKILKCVVGVEKSDINYTLEDAQMCLRIALGIISLK